MKLSSAPLDDVFQEVQYVLEADGRLLARLVLWILFRLYWVCGWVLLTVIRWPWQNSADFPELGDEPFNADDDDLEGAWQDADMETGTEQNLSPERTA
jgi:hypothetical protein